MTEAMGTEGRQATLPRLSVTHWVELGSLQGRVRIPLIMRNRSSTRETLVTAITVRSQDLPSCIGASTEPQIDLISWALCSSFL